MKKSKILLLVMVIFGAVLILTACSLGGTSSPTTVKYTVTFMVDNEVYQTATVQSGASVALPEEPEKDDYSFDGWFLDSYYLTAFDGSYITSSVKVYAKWSADDYNQEEEQEDYESGEELEYVLNSLGTAYSVAGIGSVTVSDIVIPDTYDGLAITSIDSYAFSECASIQTLTIGDNVTTIGVKVCYNAYNLEKVIIGNSVADIGGSTFLNCISLKNVYYSGSIENWCNITFGNDSANPMYCATTFYLYDSGEYNILTELTIPDSVTDIKSYTFLGFSCLVKVELPATIESINSKSFYGCYKLIEISNLSQLEIKTESAMYGYIGNYALNVYSDTEGVAKLHTDSDGFMLYADSEDELLVGYAGAESDIEIPDTVTKINTYAFDYCSTITSVTMGDNVKSIGDFAFSNCKNLTSVIIGDNVESIGHYVFYLDENLVDVVIGGSVTTINTYCFYGCNKLDKITFSDTSIWYTTTMSSYSGGSEKDVTDDEINAEYFKSTYYDKYWYKL
ncbi:MAG: leucine-rich repeat protein [Bacillota bacterium]